MANYSFDYLMVTNNRSLLSVKSESIHFCSKYASISPNFGPEKYSVKSLDLTGNLETDPSFILLKTFLVGSLPCKLDLTSILSKASFRYNDKKVQRRLFDLLPLLL